jgi:long-chain acyl-CoA synthetase
LETVAQASIHEPAIIENASTTSFGELVARSKLLCAGFEDTGLQAGDRIAVILSNNAMFAISAFAIWKFGGILAPFDVRLLEDELVKYISDCDARAIITTQRMSRTVELIQRRVEGVEHAWLWPPDGGELRYLGPPTPARSKRPSSCLNSAQPAVTLYSTGSTGFPKRVTREHWQVVEEVECVSRVMGLSESDRILGAVPFFHSYGLVSALLCGLLSGARVYAVDDFFPKDIASLIEREKITGFPGVPFMYQLLADAGTAANFGSLRYALSAGAPLSPSTAEKFASKYGIRIRQHYGTTETGFLSVEPEHNEESTDMSVGFPIPGVSIEILDSALNVIRDGEQGSVAIVSRYAASGYDRVELNTESSFRGGRFFPGDLGRLTHDGRLILTGRQRGFINVAGNKVDPSEVEAVLKQLPVVTEAIVLGLPDGAAGEKIKAVLVTKGPCTRNDVYVHCSAKLAEFKRPRVIEFRKELPKSPSGKVLRKYLIEEEQSRPLGYAFDPRTGFRPAGDSSSPDPITTTLTTLSPFLRVLLVTDGTVTKSLEAFFWEPIDIALLLHVEDRSDRDCPDLKIQVGDRASRRRVILRGRFTGSAYAFAETLIASDAFPLTFRRMLVEGEMGVGDLLREGRIETYRELVALERPVAGQWAGFLAVDTSARVALRRYNICHNGRAVIQITEVFPEDRF